MGFNNMVRIIAKATFVGKDKRRRELAVFSNRCNAEGVEVYSLLDRACSKHAWMIDRDGEYNVVDFDLGGGAGTYEGDHTYEADASVFYRTDYKKSEIRRMLSQIVHSTVRAIMLARAEHRAKNEIK
jgi:hypothetical protein